MLVTPPERIQIVFEGDEITHGNSLVRTQEDLRKESLTIYLNNFDDLTPPLIHLFTISPLLGFQGAQASHKMSPCQQPEASLRSEGERADG
jgi:hypothetical protein